MRRILVLCVCVALGLPGLSWGQGKEDPKKLETDLEKLKEQVKELELRLQKNKVGDAKTDPKSDGKKQEPPKGDVKKPMGPPPWGFGPPPWTRFGAKPEAPKGDGKTEAWKPMGPPPWGFGPPPWARVWFHARHGHHGHHHGRGLGGSAGSLEQRLDHIIKELESLRREIGSKK